MGESGGTGCNLTLSSWGGRSSLSLSGNWGLGLWRVYLRESLQTGAARRLAWCLAGSLAPAPPGWGIACQWSMWQSPSTKAAAGRLVLEEPSVPRAGGCPALQPCLGGPQALNPSSLGWLSGQLPKQGEKPGAGLCYNHH